MLFRATQLNSYHVVLEVLPALQHPTEALSSIYVNSPSTGGQVPLSTFVKWTNEPTNFLSITISSLACSIRATFIR